jgi:hypothetical protein
MPPGSARLTFDLLVLAGGDFFDGGGERDLAGEFRVVLGDDADNSEPGLAAVATAAGGITLPRPGDDHLPSSMNRLLLSPYPPERNPGGETLVDSRYGP